MSEKELIEIIEKHSLTVRCLPKVVFSKHLYREGRKLEDNQEILLEKYGRNEKQKFIRTKREIEKAGWWYVKETKHTNSIIQFQRKYDKFFAPTLEEAIQLYLDSL